MTSGDEPDETTRHEARQQDEAQPVVGASPGHDPGHDLRYQPWPPGSAASREPSPWIGQRLIGGASLLVAAGLTLGGTFLTLFTATITELRDTTFTLDASGWEFRAGADFAGNDLAGRLTGPQNGIPLAVAGGLVLVAAVLAVLAAVRAASPVFRGAAMLVGTAGAAFLLGAVTTMLVEMNYFAGSFAAAGNGGHASLGAGGWLEVVGVVLAIAGVVLVAGPWGDRRDHPVPPPFGGPEPAARG